VRNRCSDVTVHPAPLPPRPLGAIGRPKKIGQGARGQTDEPLPALALVVRLNAAMRSDRKRPPVPAKATGCRCRHETLIQFSWCVKVGGQGAADWVVTFRRNRWPLRLGFRISSAQSVPWVPSTPPPLWLHRADGRAKIDWVPRGSHGVRGV